MNAAAFGGFAAGEVRLRNVEGSRRGNEDWEMTFCFARQKNKKRITVRDITIGDGSAVVKYGWDYLWVQYASTEDATAKGLAKRPVSAYVEQVYDFADWSNVFNNEYEAP